MDYDYCFLYFSYGFLSLCFGIHNQHELSWLGFVRDWYLYVELLSIWRLWPLGLKMSTNWAILGPSHAWTQVTNLPVTGSVVLSLQVCVGPSRSGRWFGWFVWFDLMTWFCLFWSVRRSLGYELVNGG